MNKTKHTPGPWKVERHEDDLPGVTTMNDEPICDVYEHGAPGGQYNAPLIAAAPDLLAALELLMAETLNSTKPLHGSNPAIQAAIKAIYMASGV